MLIERWVRQDAALANARQAAIRLRHRRHELDDVKRFLATRDADRAQGTTSQPP